MEMHRLASYIDHTLLKADATKEQIEGLCSEAKEFKFASVCVNPAYVSLAGELLKGDSVKVCTVIGFPLGASATKVKAFETARAVEDGAQEIDMVINLGALKSQDYSTVEEDIRAVVQAAQGNLVKVIIETCLLTQEEKEIACLLSKKAGANYVKTSTGFSTGGALVEDVQLMRSVVGDKMGVKASGAVRDLKTAKAMIAAGATRIGTSSGISIVKGLEDVKEGY